MELHADNVAVLTLRREPRRSLLTVALLARQPASQLVEGINREAGQQRCSAGILGDLRNGVNGGGGIFHTNFVRCGR